MSAEFTMPKQAVYEVRVTTRWRVVVAVEDSGDAALDARTAGACAKRYFEGDATVPRSRFITLESDTEVEAARTTRLDVLPPASAAAEYMRQRMQAEESEGPLERADREARKEAGEAAVREYDRVMAPPPPPESRNTIVTLEDPSLTARIRRWWERRLPRNHERREHVVTLGKAPQQPGEPDEHYRQRMRAGPR